jgi:hypothetical protein
VIERFTRIDGDTLKYEFGDRPDVVPAVDRVDAA